MVEWGSSTLVPAVETDVDKSDDPYDSTMTYHGHHGLPDTLSPHVKFMRSQSLPHIASDAQLNRPIIKRFINSQLTVNPLSTRLSGRKTSATLNRMRYLSERTFSVVGVSDENQERGNWSNQFEFFLTCLGYAVGLGNVWRFPYLCYRNGGGAFLIPYLLMLFCCGLPLMLMELSLGQFSSEGPLTVWKLAPLFKGLGMGMLICSTLLCVYYNLITGWALYYLFVSVREQLPWTCCEPGWADDRCVSSVSSCAVYGNQSMETSKGSADQFFHKVALGITSGFGEFGTLQPHLTLALFIAWLIVFLVLMKGIKSIGKTVYFTTTFPYLVLVVLFIRALMEPGAIDGIRYYLRPDLSALLRAQVWGDAAAQVDSTIFYSTGVCQGGAICLASYNRFSNNLYRDAFVVTLGNSLTSIFSGFVVFSILGFMAHSQGSTIDQVVTSGPGLTFIAYPQAVTVLPWAPFWSAAFFLMILTLALSTMFPNVENIASSLIDQFPRQLRPYKFWVTLALCAGMFIAGIPLTTGGGMYLLQLIDTYGVGYALLVLGFVEVMVVGWRYGADNLLDNITTMIGWRPTRLWCYMWKYITPTVLLVAVFFQIWELKPIEYGEHRFPAYAGRIGWCLTMFSLLPIPIYALYKLISERYRNETLKVAIGRLTKADDFHPALGKYRIVSPNRNYKITIGDDDVFS